MPEVDGFEVMQWIRRQQSPPRAPVVVLTSSINPDHEARSIDLGAAAFHKKPDDLESLGELVRGIVEKWIGKSDIIGAHIWAAG